MEITKRQKQLIEDFNLFDNWGDKYSYLISLGKSLSEFSQEKKDHAHQVKGCQSQVWFDVVFADGKLYFQGISDSAIVSGLIGLLLKIYSDATPSDIVASTPDFMESIGLSKHLSVTRNNGFYMMVNYIYNTAKQYANSKA